MSPLGETSDPRFHFSVPARSSSGFTLLCVVRDRLLITRPTDSRRLGLAGIAAARAGCSARLAISGRIAI
jgi:hypothetical protein